MVNDPPLLASGPFSATTVEILKPALASVEEVPAKYSTESYSASDNGGDETDLPTTTTKIIVSLLDVINKIKNNPDDRRIIMSAWNPSDLKLMALPPCHMFAQFFVANGELVSNVSAVSRYGSWYLVPGNFIHVIGDAHVYRNHVRPLQEQLENPPKPFPVLKINPEKKHIDSFVAADFELIGYDPHKKIDMKMAV
ncbi:hypothetical protein F2Q70_00033486 [Brassica cretica]|uniref:thymidylate synthase n=1 Tax=Brassica cretica TaxID=69181 RepID=A0A8S9FLQ7_BRACR|nr:hypothetical protein F2Q70_00033486 [Brassica cretica]KAF2551835.1 hypothetical protein F2Q68_00037811 [Brassica cretica]